MNGRSAALARPYHLALLGLYPILALIGHNIAEMRLDEAFRALLLTAASLAGLYLLFRRLSRSPLRSALLVSFFSLLFFSYGHVYGYLELTLPALGRHRSLVPTYTLILALGSYWIVRKARDPAAITQLANGVGLVLILFPLVQIGSYQLGRLQAEGPVSPVSFEQTQEHEARPDIYLIILDAYARADTLDSEFGFDNAPFLAEMEALGFYNAACAQSNYSKTKFSLASLLNMDYLVGLGGDALVGVGENVNNALVESLIQDSQLRRSLESLGYRTVAFPTGFFWSEWTQADHYLNQDPNAVSSVIYNTALLGPYTPFEIILLETSAGLIYIDTYFTIARAQGADRGEAGQKEYLDQLRKQRAYNRVTNTLDWLDRMDSIAGPKFVFAHIVSPHSPYVIGENGAFTPDTDLRPGYTNQISYLNSRLLPLVQGIITEAEVPPIIIIQSDHGPPQSEGRPERVHILNLLYMPGFPEEQLYATLTPVNNFRLVLQHYFGADLDPLDDVSQLSDKRDFFKFTEIEAGCP